LGDQKAVSEALQRLLVLDAVQRVKDSFLAHEKNPTDLTQTELAAAQDALKQRAGNAPVSLVFSNQADSLEALQQKQTGDSLQSRLIAKDLEIQIAQALRDHWNERRDFTVALPLNPHDPTSDVYAGIITAMSVLGLFHRHHAPAASAAAPATSSSDTSTQKKKERPVDPMLKVLDERLQKLKGERESLTRELLISRFSQKDNPEFVVHHNHTQG